MAEVNMNDWEKELQILLRSVQDHPSRDMTVERNRINVLNKLIADRNRSVAA
jgi:hypothetical protein